MTTLIDRLRRLEQCEARNVLVIIRARGEGAPLVLIGGRPARLYRMPDRCEFTITNPREPYQIQASASCSPT